MKQYRQGDVLIEEWPSAIPDNAVKQPKGRAILAHGEATGHHHSLEIDPADWWKTDSEQFVTITKPTRVVHQEHAPVSLPAGKYRVRRQREYTPAAIRNVAD